MSDVGFTQTGCVKKGSASALNHFEVRMSASHVEVWASDAGTTTLRQIAVANVNLPLTSGLVWAEDVHYNACKFNDQCDHQFTWDNFGFDGPKTYRDMTFDVQDRTNTQLGWYLSASAPVRVTTAIPVSWQHTPSAAYVTFSWFAEQAAVPSVAVNGGAPQTLAWPGGDTYGWRTIAIPVPLADAQKAGPATIAFTQPGNGGNTVVSNINVVLVNAADVP